MQSHGFIPDVCIVYCNPSETSSCLARLLLILVISKQYRGMHSGHNKRIHKHLLHVSADLDKISWNTYICSAYVKVILTVLSLLTIYHPSDKIKKTEMGRACSTYGGE